MDETDEMEISDAELTELALAADPDAPIDPDAEPFAIDGPVPGLLPEWYMPVPMAVRSSKRAAVLAFVAIALLVINIGGVCVTYGIPDPVW